MIDDGQAVDIKGISDTLLRKHLKKLFISLDLEQNRDGVFLLPSNVPPTLQVVGPLIHSYVASGKEDLNSSAPLSETHSVATDERNEKMVDDEVPSPAPQRR